MGLLDELTMEKVIEENGGVEVDLGNVGSSSLDFHIIQSFCEFEKGKNTLMFAHVRFGKYERYDIRNWYDDASKPGKGLSFTVAELKKLYESIEKRDIDKYDDSCRAKYDSEKVHAKIYEQICLLSDYTTKGVKWNKEVSIVDWGYGAKYDLRKWTDDYSKCGKGITCSFGEMEVIRDEMKKLFL